MKRMLFITVISCLLICTACAHHLEEVGTYLHLTLSPQGATAEMVAHVSLSVAQTQLAVIDQDGDGAISISESSAFIASVRPTFPRGLRMEVDAKAAPFSVQSATLAIPGNSASAKSFRITATVGLVERFSSVRRSRASSAT